MTKARPDYSSAPTQLALCLQFATIYKAESWQRAATLDDSINPNSGYVRNTSVAVCNLYCVRVIIIR
jgi:hypothetical protein